MQVTSPSQFKLAKSKAGDNAGLGLWFKGEAKKDDILVGYGGTVGTCDKEKGFYTVKCGVTNWCLNSTNLRKLTITQSSIYKYPLGHMINRPGTYRASNCYRFYQQSTGLLFAKAKKHIHSSTKWTELVMAYNDRRVG